MTSSADKRVARTRAAVITAFNSIVLSRSGEVRASDIITHANVGRSTFYDHFANAEDVHIEALARPYATLADTAAGAGSENHLIGLFEHLWENRRRARETFDNPRLYERSMRMLATLIAVRLEPCATAFSLPLPLLAALLAQAAHAPIKAWIAGAAP